MPRFIVTNKQNKQQQFVTRFKTTNLLKVTNPRNANIMFEIMVQV